MSIELASKQRERERERKNNKTKILNYYFSYNTTIYFLVYIGLIGCIV